MSFLQLCHAIGDSFDRFSLRIQVLQQSCTFSEI